MKIVALDPGGTTGWAVFEVQMDSNGVFVWKQRGIQVHFTDFGQIGNNNEHHKKLYVFLASEQPDVLVCERFDNRDNEFAQIMSREYIGIVKLWVDLKQNQNKALYWQGADQAKGWATDDKLVRLGIMAKPKTVWVHANDALRHLVYFLCAGKGDRIYPGIRTPLLERLKREP